MDGHLTDTMMTIQEKNNFSHISFIDLQREFQIPTVEEGRTVSVHFFYGQLVGVINNVLTSRRTLAINLRDADKIDAFIRHKRSLDPQCPYVARYLEAQNNIRDIERDARPMHDFFLRRIQAMQVLNTLLTIGSVTHPTWNCNPSLGPPPETVILLWGKSSARPKANLPFTMNSKLVTL